MKALLLRTFAVVLVAGLLFDVTPTGAQTSTLQCEPTCTISWLPPAEYTDGTQLLEQDIDFYSFYCDGNRIVDLNAVIGTWTAEITFSEPIFDRVVVSWSVTPSTK